MQGRGIGARGRVAAVARRRCGVRRYGLPRLSSRCAPFHPPLRRDVPDGVRRTRQLDQEVRSDGRARDVLHRLARTGRRPRRGRDRGGGAQRGSPSRAREPMRLLGTTLAAVALLLWTGPAAAAPPNAADLEAELVCPVCETTLDQSSSPVAERMKTFIRVRIAAGDSEQEIKDVLVAQFGPAVLAEPPGGGFGLLAWLLPLAALAAGAVAVALLVRSWSSRRAPKTD